VSATTGFARSIHVRLVARAKDLGIEPQLLLERYALHRLLYRLSISKHAERFLLKGAQLMLLWLGETVRSTRDADLLGFGDLSDASLQSIFTDLCGHARAR
jgi:predicted nucleotidyltransferase component of viral defense system